MKQKHVNTVKLPKALENAIGQVVIGFLGLSLAVLEDDKSAPSEPKQNAVK